MTVKNENEGKRDESGISQEAALDNEDLWGSDMYPERRGKKFQHSWFKILLGAQGRESIDKNRCEHSVYKCIKESKISLIYIRRNKNQSVIHKLTFDAS